LEVTEMQIPEELFYHPEHTWARIDGDTATVGITDHAQRELGEIVFVEVPKAGRTLAFGEVFGYIESSKSVSDLFSPVAGEVVEVNSALEDDPEVVNEDPYGEGWMIRVRVESGFDTAALQTAAAYTEHLAQLEQS
jgi:glycine cleavage system H protein